VSPYVSCDLPPMLCGVNGAPMKQRRGAYLGWCALALAVSLGTPSPAQAQTTQCLTEGVNCEEAPLPPVTDGLGQSAPGTVPTTAPTTSSAPGTGTVPTSPSSAPSSSTAVASPSTVAAGHSVTVQGTGPFAANQPLQVFFDGAPPSPPVTAQSDAAGAYVATVTVPSTASSGTHRITVSGPGPQGGTHESIATVMVGLADTGFVTDVMAIVGAAVLALGLHLVRRSQWSAPVSTKNWVPSPRRG
jgi:hypothetical protein